MYEYVFWSNFAFIVTGLWIALVFVLIGVVIGGCLDKGKSCFNHNHDVLFDRDSNSGDSSVGDLHGEVNN